MFTMRLRLNEGPLLTALQLVVAVTFVPLAESCVICGELMELQKIDPVAVVLGGGAAPTTGVSVKLEPEAVATVNAPLKATGLAPAMSTRCPATRPCATSVVPLMVEEPSVESAVTLKMGAQPVALPRLVELLAVVSMPP